MPAKSLVLAALVIATAPVLAVETDPALPRNRQLAQPRVLPECPWTTKTRWATGEAKLVKPAGSGVSPISVDVLVRFDARTGLEDDKAGRQVVLKLSRPGPASTNAPTMSFPKSTIRLVIDGTETLRFTTEDEGERPIAEAFKDGITKAKTLEVFANDAGREVPLIGCTLTGTVEALREMETPARNFAVQEKFKKLQEERWRKTARLQTSVCRERVQVGLTRIKWDHQDDLKACQADESCIKKANDRRDARTKDAQRQLSECDTAGSK